jgi:hypothetical protein
MPVTLHDKFHYHAPSSDGITRHAELSEACLKLATIIDDICPDGREKALSLTNLEQSKFWASAAVARNPETV